MDLLRPGHAHRSSSDRLLSNYLDSQKQLKDALLTLLSHAHPSTSSLLAYVTSSPGVVQPVRKAVRHSGFEGPLSGALLEAHGSQLGSNVGMDETQGWAAFMSSMDAFRKDLKHIHGLEEEMSRVRRDREILVTRLIKTTKSRPTKSDLASNYSQTAMSSRASSLSVTSDGSAATKEGKRAGKLADAQAELLGCEEHLRGLEVRIEKERNKVMLRGLEERFRAMEAVGRMWVSQAKKGLGDLDKAHDLPPNAYELDSNGSIAPSQSASQVGYEDSPASHRRGHPFPRGLHGANGPGSITGSIAEENEEGSSDDDGPRNLTVHENRPGAATPRPSSAQARRNSGGNGNYKASPLGVPSVTNYRPRPQSAAFGNNGGDSSDSDAPNPRAGGRRAASDVGGMSYTPITKRRSLMRRTASDDQVPTSGGGLGGGLQRTNSGSSSSVRAGVPVKKKGFFASIGRLFKSKRREASGRESPPYGSGSKGGWATRTDTNLRRGGSRMGRGGGNDSSSDEEGGNLVSVSNNRNAWSAADVGRIPAGGNKRNSNLPVASGLIPPKPTRSNSDGFKKGPGSTTSTITARNTARAGAKSPTAGGIGGAGVNRSNTVKSTTSAGTARTTGTVKSGAGSVKKTRQNGSISRGTGLSAQPATSQNNMMSLVSGKSNDPKNPAAPIMPDIPKAPRSQVNPQMELPKAPGSSIVRPGDPHREVISKDELHPHHSISRSNSLQKVPQVTTNDPLPSRMQPPPLKSALRPSSPQPLAPPLEMPKTLISVTAPGPVELPRDTKPLPSSFPIAPAQANAPRPRPDTRTSYTSYTTEEGASVYESAVDGEGGRQYAADSSSSEDEDEGSHARYKTVDNERVKRLGINVGPPAIERIPSDQMDNDSDGESVDTELAQRQTQSQSQGKPIEDDRQSRMSNRKSVRITAPDSPMDTVHAPAPLTEGYPSKGNGSRDPSPEPARPTDPKWSTRIGRMRDDTSEEEDEDEGYTRARRGLSRQSGQFQPEAQSTGKKVAKSKSGSVRSKGSARK